jgi:hypothetical protein
VIARYLFVAWLEHGSSGAVVDCGRWQWREQGGALGLAPLVEARCHKRIKRREGRWCGIRLSPTGQCKCKFAF